MKKPYVRKRGLFEEPRIAVSPDSGGDAGAEFMNTLSDAMRPDYEKFAAEELAAAEALAMSIITGTDVPADRQDVAHAILQDVVIARCVLTSPALAQAFLCGTSLAKLCVQLDVNIKFESTVRARQKSLKDFPNKPTVTDDQIRSAVASHPTKQAAADVLGLSTRQLRTRLKHLG